MFADHFLDGNCAGHGRLRSHGGCHRAKGKAGRAPDGIQKRRAHLAFVQQRFEGFEMLDLLLHHMLDFGAGRMVAKDGQLATVDLLGGSLSGVIDTQESLDVAPSGDRS